MIFRISRFCAPEAPRGPKMSPRRPKMARRGLQEGPRWPQGGSKRAQAGTKMAPREPKMANLAQRALPDAPGTPPDPSGERFRDPFCPENGPPEAKIVDKTMLFQWGGSEATAPRFWLPAALLRGHYVGTRRTRLGRKRPSRAPDKLWI